MKKHASLTLALAAVSAALIVSAASGVALGQAAPGAEPRAALPGKGPAQHPFLYAGEWDTRKPLEQSIFVVRGGKVTWQYSMPLRTPADRDSGVRRRHLAFQWEHHLLENVRCGGSQSAEATALELRRARGNRGAFDTGHREGPRPDHAERESGQGDDH